MVRLDEDETSSLVETVPKTDDKDESFVNHQGRDKTTRTLQLTTHSVISDTVAIGSPLAAAGPRL